MEHLAANWLFPEGGGNQTNIGLTFIRWTESWPQINAAVALCLLDTYIYSVCPVSGVTSNITRKNSVTQANTVELAFTTPWDVTVSGCAFVSLSWSYTAIGSYKKRINVARLASSKPLHTKSLSNTSKGNIPVPESHMTEDRRSQRGDRNTSSSSKASVVLHRAVWKVTVIVTYALTSACLCVCVCAWHTLPSSGGFLFVCLKHTHATFSRTQKSELLSMTCNIILILTITPLSAFQNMFVGASWSCVAVQGNQIFSRKFFSI